MNHSSDDGSEGYPGSVKVSATFELKPDNQLCISLVASAALHPTPINLTNHSYFNLAGHVRFMKDPNPMMIYISFLCLLIVEGFRLI